MPYCKNNLKKTYTGNEPSPKGLGYCASGEKEGTEMKGKDGNMWIKKNGKWIKKNSKENYYKKIFDKLYKWWLPLSQGNIIIIYTIITSKGIKETKNKLIKSNMKTHHAQSKDIIEKWNKFGEKSEIKAIIWSSQSVDSIQFFVEFLLKKMNIEQLEEFLKIKNLPEYILENYKKYFKKNKLYSDKDYYLKNLII
jgi:hypothetical protein